MLKLGITLLWSKVWWYLEIKNNFPNFNLNRMGRQPVARIKTSNEFLWEFLWVMRLNLTLIKEEDTFPVDRLEGYWFLQTLSKNRRGSILALFGGISGLIFVHKNYSLNAIRKAVGNFKFNIPPSYTIEQTSINDESEYFTSLISRKQ